MPHPLHAAASSRPLHAIVALLLGVISASGVSAANLSVAVSDAAGRPLADAVVYAVSRDRPPPAARAPAAVEQADKQFMPLVTVVQTGSAVRFPNRDTVRHHVYSFSPAKRFELKLYVGDPPEPVVFDKPGEVVLGCNIHDQMVAYVYVVDTPYFGKSAADGAVTLGALPDGAYELRAWHPHQQRDAAVQPFTVAGDRVPPLRVTLALDATAGSAR